ncbi:hypothetical protein DW228_06315 [Bacteroides fragilis]|uniref:Uncharacterized protein n=1 Tax=Bacteroides fragilis TaxID=817 RepID=A0A396C1H6_BACFG|nr:hypothetical protein [Bacteroides fragilis]RHH14411.1 hypothetical protein DW228_06315 [Bacteroides fragilis]
MIVNNHREYACFDYENKYTQSQPNIRGEVFLIGEVVYDGEGDIGIVLQIWDKSEIRLDSNGNQSVNSLSKCPDEIASHSIQKRRKIRPL